LASLCATVPFISDPAIAEAYAAWKAAGLCCELGLQRIILEGDASVIVQALQQTDPSRSPYGQLIGDIQSMLNRLPFWQVSHVPRLVNGVAHRLAKAAITQSINCVWHHGYPDFIQEYVLAEQDSLL
jgi:hypothetical protein